MIKDRPHSDDSSAGEAQAMIIRAFYDAADRILANRNLNQTSTQAVFMALRELSDVVARAKAEGSQEFADTLERAANKYFERVAAIQGDLPPELH